MDNTPKTEEQYKQKLTPEEYAVLREGATEAPFTGAYYDNHKRGMYYCKACGQMLFSSDTKFDSGTGWPSFTNPVNTEHVILKEDRSQAMTRTEVLCKNCGSHLGHVFDDGPVDRRLPAGRQGKRFCINSCALDFQKKE